MKGKIRKNQVVIATLAVLIAIAGYISYDKKGIDLKENSQQVAHKTVLSADKEAEHGKHRPEKDIEIVNKRHKRLLSLVYPKMRCGEHIYCIINAAQNQVDCERDVKLL